MEAMYLLIVISLVFVVGIAVAFWWAIFAGQYDQGEKPGQAILDDDDVPRSQENASSPVRVSAHTPGKKS